MIEAGKTYRSQGYAMFNDYGRDHAGDPVVELWRFCGEDDPEEGFGFVEITVHEIVETERSGAIAVYYKQWFAPDGQPAWGSRRKRRIGSLGSLKAMFARRKMTEHVPA